MQKLQCSLQIFRRRSRFTFFIFSHLFHQSWKNAEAKSFKKEASLPETIDPPDVVFLELMIVPAVHYFLWRSTNPERAADIIRCTQWDQPDGNLKIEHM